MNNFSTITPNGVILLVRVAMPANLVYTYVLLHSPVQAYVFLANGRMITHSSRLRLKELN